MTTLFFGSIITFLYFLATRWRKKPTHEGEWEMDYAHLPRIELREHDAVLKNVRDWRYAKSAGRYAQDYHTDTVAYEEFARAWVVVEPFMFAKRIAHVFLVFELTDGRAYGVSIEARRRLKQGFRPFRALFREYELMYQWGTERDLLSLRALRRRNELLMVPLVFSKEQTRVLFKELAEKTNVLFDRPRFYNTLFANCTTELFDPLATIHTRYALSPRSRFLTGTLIEALSERGLIDERALWKPYDNIAERVSALPEHVLTDRDPKAFSVALRTYTGAQ